MGDKILRKLQLEELTILDELDRICKKHNIDYFISYGTALGAVRHGGFIPWDDDIDVSMTMENYKKFEEVVKKDLDNKFFYQSFDTEKHIFIFWDKIRINNTLSTINGQENLPLHLGICIDVFPLSKYPKNPKLQKKFKKMIKYALVILETELYKLKLKNVGLIGNIFYKLMSLIPTNIRRKVAQELVNKVLYYDGDFEYYAEFTEVYKRVLLFPKRVIEEQTTINFENKKYPIVKDYDKYLTIAYGDYMKLPPKKDRKAHGNLTLKFSDGEEYKNEK